MSGGFVETGASLKRPQIGSAFFFLATFSAEQTWSNQQTAKGAKRQKKLLDGGNSALVIGL